MEGEGEGVVVRLIDLTKLFPVASEIVHSFSQSRWPGGHLANRGNLRLRVSLCLRASRHKTSRLAVSSGYCPQSRQRACQARVELNQVRVLSE